MHYLYILKSQSKDWYYVGMTDNLKKRLAQHNLGKTKSTKPYRPFKIVYTETYQSKTECRKRELFIKNNHAAKQAIVENMYMVPSSNG
ncbi:MAG: GIY-YIG nuclease family protein [Candidatus Doudnabacteria bacterium]